VRRRGLLVLALALGFAALAVVDVEEIGELQLKGFSHAIAVVNVLGMRERLKAAVEAG
jgi:hypothetical protein